MNKEEHFLRNRFLELANNAYSRNIYTNTDFLNLNEQNILHQMKQEFPSVHITLTGGNDFAERKIAIFSPPEIYYELSVPIVMLEIAPINSQFAEKLTHRDYLGAILNLGIQRSKIGDLMLFENKTILFCMEDIASYIQQQLFRIRHTQVQIRQILDDFQQFRPALVEKRGTISNVRLDSLIALAFGTSRSSIITFIQSGKVFVNGKLITSNGYTPKEKDIISVRGKGRFQFGSVLGQTKKGRNLVSIYLYQ